MTTRPATAPPTSNAHLIRWVEKMAELTQPDHPLGHRHARRVRDPVRQAGRGRHLLPARRQEVAGLFLCPLRAHRCGARGRPHLHLLPLQGKRRPHQQLGRPLCHAQADEAALHRLHARPHHVRASLLHGPGRFTHIADRRRTHRLRLCRRQYAHHVAHRPACTGRDRQGYPSRHSLHAHRGRAAGARAEGRSLAL